MGRFGLALFAVALAGFGVLSLTSGDFPYVWRPVPSWVPGRVPLAYASGAALFACSVALLWPRTRARASLVLTLAGAASMLLLHVPRVANDPRSTIEWFNLGEVAAMTAGSWVVLGRDVTLARRLFALALVPFGISHFVYARMTASMVPSWLPWHLAWTYATGAAHTAAGIAILVGVRPRLAATLEAIMVTVFLATVNAPELVRKPAGRGEWTEVFVAAAIAGAAFLVARSYRGDTAARMERHFAGG